MAPLKPPKLAANVDRVGTFSSKECSREAFGVRNKSKSIPSESTTPIKLPGHIDTLERKQEKWYGWRIFKTGDGKMFMVTVISLQVPGSSDQISLSSPKVSPKISSPLEDEHQNRNSPNSGGGKGLIVVGR